MTNLLKAKVLKQERPITIFVFYLILEAMSAQDILRDLKIISFLPNWMKKPLRQKYGG